VLRQQRLQHNKEQVQLDGPRRLTGKSAVPEGADRVAIIVIRLFEHENLALTLSTPTPSALNPQVLQMDGDPLDACSAAAFLALGCTRVPRTELVAGETGLLEDFDVLGDLALAKPISIQSVPISITVAKVGEVLLFDASGEEQQCASCVLSIAIDRSGKCCGLTYLRHGLLEPGEVTSCIDVRARHLRHLHRMS
jgi:hypothetical protein